MRAHYLEDLSVKDVYILNGEQLHHLVHVIRIEIGEELLLINGKGLIVIAVVEQVTKKELRLKFVKEQFLENNSKLDLVLGMPKREALDLCIKQVVELGYKNVYLVRSDYSQMKFPDKDRVKGLMVSALEQSNAAYFPNIIEANWDDIPFDSYQEVMFFDSQSKKTTGPVANIKQKNQLIIIGPEGGFSNDEIVRISERKNVRSIHLPIPILRTPTALAVATGIALRALID